MVANLDKPSLTPHLCTIIHLFTFKVFAMFRFIVDSLLYYFLPIILIGFFAAIISDCSLSAVLRESYSGNNAALFFHIGWGIVSLIVAGFRWDDRATENEIAAIRYSR